MPRDPSHPGAPDDDDNLDPEGPDESEMDFSDEPDLEVCPHCRKMISEEAERCPHCGQYVIPGDAPLTPMAWIVIGVIVVSLIVLLVRML